MHALIYTVKKLAGWFSSAGPRSAMVTMRSLMGPGRLGRAPAPRECANKHIYRKQMSIQWFLRVTNSVWRGWASSASPAHSRFPLVCVRCRHSIQVCEQEDKHKGLPGMFKIPTFWSISWSNCIGSEVTRALFPSNVVWMPLTKALAFYSQLVSWETHYL